ncbi:Protein of unknown function [Gryllus bimaculatus]|nr:Protein of unknown function [Gryllus bimaculatus]
MLDLKRTSTKKSSAGEVIAPHGTNYAPRHGESASAVDEVEDAVSKCIKLRILCANGGTCSQVYDVEDPTVKSMK